MCGAGAQSNTDLEGADSDPHPGSGMGGRPGQTPAGIRPPLPAKKALTDKRFQRITPKNNDVALADGTVGRSGVFLS